MITRIITRSKTLKRQGRQFLIKSSTKAEHFADKYQIIKKLLVIGTLTNLYFCYNSYVRFSIYNEISTGIADKFNQWNDNQVRNKEMIFELMKEMESMKSEKTIQSNQYGFDQSKQRLAIVETKTQISKEQRPKGQKQNQKQKGSSFWSFFKGNKNNKSQKKDQYI